MRRVDLGIGIVAGVVAVGIGTGALVATRSDGEKPKTPATASPKDTEPAGAPEQLAKNRDLSPPAEPVETTADDSSVSLKWGASGGDVTGYRVYDGTKLLAAGNGNELQVKGLKPCSAYKLAVSAFNAKGESRPTTLQVRTGGCERAARNPVATTYLHLGWGRPPRVKKVMKATGLKTFTMSFILSDGGCAPAWDGGRPLKGGVDARTIAAVKAAGGNVHISFGGWSGRKLGPACSSPQAYAAAVQKVVDAYRPTALDFDMESDELRNAAVQDRILRGMKIVKRKNPGIRLIVTMSTGKNGPDRWGVRLIRQAKTFGVDIDNYTIMPFNFGGSNVRTDTVRAAQGLKRALKAARGWSDSTAYSRMGISGMNGHSDEKEVTTLASWKAIRDWSSSHGLGRLAFWSVNRDRPCPGDVRTNCSGVPQDPWQFTRITAGF
ncbi:chitinase [Actinocorallia sp. B10E7]|uniref:fibronectin type III domain-containing protein n=1 Tax=Actinocorallia sp. B10E7 TaxID=3153558 RepID=UPI00325EC353